MKTETQDQEIQQLRKQLAAAVDALKRLNERRWYDGTGEIIREALAKIGEGE